MVASGEVTDQNIGVLADALLRMCLDDALDGRAGIELLHCHDCAVIVRLLVGIVHDGARSKQTSFVVPSSPVTFVTAPLSHQ